MKFSKLGIGHIHQYDLRDFKGRAFFTTDIHGHFDLLHHELRNVAFDSSKDILFVGGDNCDRGPYSKYILDYVNEPWHISIRGNHEELFIASHDVQWMPDNNSVKCLKVNGGEWAWEVTEIERKMIYESFKVLPLAIELLLPEDTVVGIIHAEVPYNDWEQFKAITKAELEWDGEATAQWARSWYSQSYSGTVKGVDCVLAGHTPTDSGNVERMGNMVFCDAGSFFRDKLNLFEITTEFVRSVK